jgi:phosphoribosylformimino-5-aminoimidazole carboxamide ribotide isomerase
LHDGTDPVSLARLSRGLWGLPDLYLADLDAILGEAAPNHTLFRALRDLGLTLWVDAGVRDSRDLPGLLEAGVERIIVGLETIRGPEALAEVVAQAGTGSVVFSLDLYRSRPMIDTKANWGTDRAEEIASRAIEAGVRRLIHLDLARVGTGRGIAPLDGLVVPEGHDVEWIVGGGISGIEEVLDLERCGVRGVLVGSALHDGRITARDLRTVSMWPADLPPSPSGRGPG